jgi:serine/threonine protein kinase/tetratricopeptide (TPR) repeat protein
VRDAVLFHNYELLDRIAEGGMAEVWRARSRGAAGFEKTVVIKRVLPSLMANPGFAELLVREAKIASRLSHANIVQIFDLGEEAGAYFIAMEYVDGKDLGAVMAYEARAASSPGRPRLSVPLKLWIIAETAKALDYAHRRRGDDGRALAIVHRDISPQNILVGYEGEVKVADFGIARADQQDLGRGEDPKMLRGKFAYMSPEQARGMSLDRRSDLFALGIVLWELATGRRLFKAAGPQETLELVRRAEIPDFPFEQSGWPAEIRGVLRRALSVDLEGRYASAGELQQDLSQILFRLGENVGETELGEALTRMFPRMDAHSPNKLRVDLLLRAQDDATGASAVPLGESSDPEREAARDRTAAALPVSRRVSVQSRRVALLAVRARDAEELAGFGRAVEAYGGQLLPGPAEDAAAVFGADGGERAVEYAGRAALELRRRAAIEGPLRAEPVPPLAVAMGDARVYDGARAVPEDALFARARDLVLRASAGEVVIDPALAEELGRTFRVGRAPNTALPTLEGYRARRERDAQRIRRRAPLVGRSREAAALSEALFEVAGRGTGEAVLLLGETGAGKSRLLAELRAATVAQGVVFASACGQEGERERSFGALADLFKDLCGVEEEDTPAERHARVERLRVLGLAPREVRLVGELLGLAYPVARQERVGRPRGVELMLAARKALTALARDRVVVLAIEDVHWIDPATRQLLPLLLRELARSRVLAVIAARPGTPVPSVDGEPRVIELHPLDEASALRLFASASGGRVVAERLARDVLDETGGNPAWVEELAAALRGAQSLRVQDGEVQLAEGARVPLPQHVRTVVSAALASLRAADLDLLRIAASFEGSLDVSLLCAVHGAPLAVAESGLRRLLVRRLLVPESGTSMLRSARALWGGGTDAPPVPPRLRVASGVARRTVLEAMSSGERALLHGRAYAELDRLGRDACIEDLAHHAARLLREDGARADDVEDRAVALAFRGAELAAGAGAVTLVDEALALLATPAPGAGGAVHRIRVAVLRARAAAARGDSAQRVAALDAVAGELGEVKDLALRGAAELELAEGLAGLGRAREALVRLRSAVETLSHGADAALYGRALCVLAESLARAALVDEAEQVVGRALTVAARLGDGVLRFGSLAAMAEVAESRGEILAAAARFQEAGEVAAAQGLLIQQARMAARAALASFVSGEFESASRHAAETSALARKVPAESLVRLGVVVAVAVGVVRVPDPGAIDELAAHAEFVVGHGTDFEAASALRVRAFGERASGRRAEARRSVARASQFAERAGLTALCALLRAEESLDSPVPAT